MRRRRIRKKIALAYSRIGNHEIISHGSPAVNHEKIRKQGLASSSYFYRMPEAKILEILHREGSTGLFREVAVAIENNVYWSQDKDPEKKLANLGIVIGQTHRTQNLVEQEKVQYALDEFSDDYRLRRVGTGAIPARDILFTITLSNEEIIKLKKKYGPDESNPKVLNAASRILSKKIIRHLLRE
jgi:hypothetical protein